MADGVDARHVVGGDQIDARPQPRATPSQINQSQFVSDCYKMSHGNRGIAVIINNKKFHPQTRMNVRNGTDTDALAMYELLDTLGFTQIIQKNDLTVQEMLDTLKAASQADHSKHDCFVCVILSHGEEGVLYGTDAKIEIDKLVKPFKGNNCQSLAGKPKLFFIQACRGTELDHGTTVADAAGEDEDVDVRRIPTEADFLIAYSVVPGYYSWRNSAKGSWFIQAVHEVFMKHWRNMDVLTMMTRVNKKVAYDFESTSEVETMNMKKQIPCITSMLTKDIFFKN